MGQRKRWSGDLKSWLYSLASLAEIIRVFWELSDEGLRGRIPSGEKDLFSTIDGDKDMDKKIYQNLWTSGNIMGEELTDLLSGRRNGKWRHLRSALSTKLIIFRMWRKWKIRQRFFPKDVILISLYPEETFKMIYHYEAESAPVTVLSLVFFKIFAYCLNWCH